MIDRFNFFDVYAYLLPGMALLGLMWVPFGVVYHRWPTGDFSPALLLLVAAYILGHVLYYPAKRALPTESQGSYPPGACGRRAEFRHPSEYLMDAGEKSFPDSIKEKLADFVK